ncbi:Leucine-rich repeat containing protein [Gossypium australe]|uniref:Leucine-rich repeat containing protein n=1 Tax=Gossypium australe TaxID=47621 RepID=A0A5B6VVS9_9ROSI|nr:Leucine-rich repeat containing protein [Gossypium australe]
MQLREIRPRMQYLSSVRHLGIIDCRELESLSPSLKHLPKLESIEIFSCPIINLLMEPQEIEDQNLHLSLKKLAIHDAPNLRDLPQLLLEASASNLMISQRYHTSRKFTLKTKILSIHNKEPQVIEDQNLHLNLEKLKIFKAPNLRDLPRLLLKAFASHLEFIQIQSCLEIEALPNWL